jgi:DNA-binding HxlR family transcriptional regulator
MSSESSLGPVDSQHPDGNTLYFVDTEAAFSAVRAVLGRKWHLRIVYYLLDSGPHRFSDLRDHVEGISSKMLSESLSRLEAAGLVDREVVDEKPLEVEYSLTEDGEAVLQALDEPMTVDELAAKLELDTDKVHDRLAHLSTFDRVRRDGDTVRPVE